MTTEIKKYASLTMDVKGDNVTVWDCVPLAYGNGFFMEGYMMAQVETAKTDGCSYEITFRIKDDENGNEMKLISIDYGYQIPNIDEIWDGIENMCKQIVTENGYYDFVVNSIGGGTENEINKNG